MLFVIQLLIIINLYGCISYYSLKIRLLYYTTISLSKNFINLKKWGFWLEAEHQALLKQLGSRIRSFREERGFSQEELGFRSNLHRTYISEVELGQKNPTYLTLLKISEALSVNILDLIPKN
jgi:DNA-binding XRE family transcriptional regulator